ncbi:MAG: multidrug transporter [Cellvibrio sp. 79]|nr:MAG: multidrug transporter [Cellvibrio sp. 79]
MHEGSAVARFETLSNVNHQNLHIITRRHADYGDNLMHTLTFPQEFRSIQAHYPIFFRKQADTGVFEAVAMFGFKHEQNLFLDENGWDASYIPLMILRQPFLIGFQQQQENGEMVKRPVVQVDMENPRISNSEGERVFMEFGGYTEYLNKMVSILDYIHYGHETSRLFMQALVALNLIESLTVDIELEDGSKNQLIGYYTINEDVLNKLPQEDLFRLHQHGFLEPIYMVLASQSRIAEMIARINARNKNERLAAQN